MSTDDNVRPWMRWLLIGALVYLFADQLWLRVQGYVPWDLWVYLYAARAAAEGASPYTAEFVAAVPRNFPYVYAPGTLDFVRPLDLLTPRQAAISYFLVQCGLLLGACRYMQKRYLAGQPYILVVGLALAFFPFYRDFVSGNIAILLLSATLGTVHAAEKRGDDRRGWHLIFPLVMGVLGGFKPFWLIPAGFAALAHRSWRVAAAMGAGLGVVAAATIARWELVEGWLATLSTSSQSDPTGDLLRLHWGLAVGLMLCWLAVAAYLIVRDRRTPSEFGMTSLVVWPRLQPYSYVIAFPVLLWLIDRLGWKRAGWLIVPVSTPLTYAYSPEGSQPERWIFFGWAALILAISLAKVWPGDLRDEA